MSRIILCGTRHKTKTIQKNNPSSKTLFFKYFFQRNDNECWKGIALLQYFRQKALVYQVAVRTTRWGRSSASTVQLVPPTQPLVSNGSSMTTRYKQSFKYTKLQTVYYSHFIIELGACLICLLPLEKNYYSEKQTYLLIYMNTKRKRVKL